MDRRPRVSAVPYDAKHGGVGREILQTVLSPRAERAAARASAVLERVAPPGVRARRDELSNFTRASAALPRVSERAGARPTRCLLYTSPSPRD